MFESRVNRLKDVSRMPHFNMGEESRTDEEALDIIRKAVYRTKGKCNNGLAWLIALQKDSTVDDVIKFGSKGFDSINKPLQTDGHRKYTPWQRMRIQDNKRTVTVRDTYIKRHLEAKGLWTESLDNELGGMYTNFMDCITRDSRARKLSRVLTYSKYVDMTNKFISECSNLMNYWIEHTSLEVDPNKQWTKDRKKFFDAELKWLGDAPSDIREKLAKKELGRTPNFTQVVFNSGLFHQWEDTPTSAEFCELAKMFVEVMEHIGLGVADTEDHFHMTMPAMRINIKSLMKKTIGMGSLFAKLLKQGFDPSLARAEVVDQLNQYVRTSKSKLNWQFFALENAPEKYDYQAKPKSSKTSNGSRRGRRLDGVDAEGCMDIPGIGKVKVA